MLTPLNEQLSGNQPPPSMQPPPTPPGTAPQSPMHPMAPSTLGELPPTPPLATRPAIGNPATPFADPTRNTPTLGIGQQLAAQGRGPDSALVHMAPRELQGLNALAQSSTGQNLPINPKTGLPEAGILSSLLPMLIGAVLTPLTGGIINPLTAGLLVGGGYGLATHSLTKGLMAGLSAYGGAGIATALGGLVGGGLASAAGLGGSAASAGTQAVQDAVLSDVAPTLGGAAPGAASAVGDAAAGLSAMPTQALSAAASAAPSATQNIAPLIGAGAPGGIPGDISAFMEAPQVASAAPTSANFISSAVPNITPPPPGGLAGFGHNFADALRAGGQGPIPGTNITAPGLPGMIPRWASTAAGVTGITSALSDAMTPGAPKTGTGANKYNPASYAGPYKPIPRVIQGPPADFFGPDGIPKGSGEYNWFKSSQPDVPYTYTTQAGGAPPGYPGYVPPTKAELDARMATLGYAKGGLVSLKPGGFVMDARTVSEVGNGSSNAGKEILRKHGGQPIDGGGDGVSDNIPAHIMGGPRARVARDEVHFPPEAVARIGRGNRRRGAQKLYGMMAQAKVARAHAGRGADTGLRRGLA